MIMDEQVYTCFTLEVEFKVPVSWVRVIIASQPAFDTWEYIFVELNAENFGTVSVQELNVLAPKEKQDYEFFDLTPRVQNIFDPNQWNKLHIDVSGRTITVTVDDTIVFGNYKLVVNDSTRWPDPFGRVGLWASPVPDSGFDDFVLSAIPCEN